MKLEQIRELAGREPFRTFTIVLESGREVEINSDTELFFPRNQPGVIFAFTSEGRTWIFEADAVNAVHQGNGTG